MHSSYIPFHQPDIDDDDIQAVVDTLRSGWLTTGPQVKRFEEAFCAYTGSPHAMAVNSCTAAMHLALAALGIGPGDAVITTPYTFVATTEAILYVGATPVLVDVREKDFNLDPQRIEQVLESREGARVRAILPVHVAGHPCAMPEIMDLAERYGLLVVEDAAHALEAAIATPHSPRHSPHSRLHTPADWWKIGTIGDATCFSFYATKNITTAEGGMVTVKDAALAEKIRSLALHGMSRDAWKRYAAEGNWYYEIEAQGFKYNMPDVLAALGISQLKRVERLYAQRRKYVEIYNEHLSELDALITPGEPADIRHAWHLYLLRLKSEKLTLSRNAFIEALRVRGIGTSVHFIPLHLHPYYRRTFGYRPGDFPVAERLYENAVSLPLYPGLSESDVYFVARTVRDVVGRHYRRTSFPGGEAGTDIAASSEAVNS